MLTFDNMESIEKIYGIKIAYQVVKIEALRKTSTQFVAKGAKAITM